MTVYVFFCGCAGAAPFLSGVVYLGFLCDSSRAYEVKALTRFACDCVVVCVLYCIVVKDGNLGLRK